MQTELVPEHEHTNTKSILDQDINSKRYLTQAQPYNIDSKSSITNALFYVNEYIYINILGWRLIKCNSMEIKIKFWPSANIIEKMEY